MAQQKKKSRIPVVLGALLGLAGAGGAALAIRNIRGGAASSPTMNLIAGAALGTTSWLATRLLFGKDSRFARGLGGGLAVGYAGAWVRQSFLTSPEERLAALKAQAQATQAAVQIGHYLGGGDPRYISSARQLAPSTTTELVPSLVRVNA